MSGLRYNSGKTKSIGQGTPVDRTNLNPSLYEGMMVYDVDKQLYYSNGSIWILVQPANVEFSSTGNNTLFINGKQEIQLAVNSAVFSTNSIFAYTANNARFAYGKQEAQLSVNAATFAINSVSASLAVTANNSTFAYGKQEAQLSVANSALSNNSTFAYGKQEAQLSVANSALSNNSTFAYGKQEAQLSVSAANNSSLLLGRTWESPADIGTSLASNGIFTNVTVLNNLTVNGTITIVNTSITTSNNTFIILNDAQETPFNDMGFVFQRYETPSANNYNVALFWDEATKQIIIGKAENTVSTNSQNLSITSQFLSASETGLVTINGQLNANVVTTNALTIKTLTANGSSGTARQFLTSNGASGTYWYTLEQALPITNDNTSSINYYLPMSNGVSGNWSNAVIADARLSFTPSTGTLTANQGAFTDALISGNTYINKLFANGNIGGIGQVLVSNGAGIYWENSLTIAPRAGFGLSSNATHYQVNANSGIIANNNGTYVNAAYIATISSNNTTYMNGKQEGQLSVNAAVFTTNSQFSFTSNNANYANVALLANNSTYLAGRTWGSPFIIGADVANNAFFANTVSNIAQIGTLTANGSSGTFGQILASNGTGLYWTSNPPGIAIPLVQNNTSTSVWYFPMSNTIVGSWSQGSVSDGGLSYVPSTCVLRIKTANVGTAIIANAVITGIFANNSFGNPNSLLVSNGTSVYWSSDLSIRYDLISVANTGPNRGIVRLTDTLQSNDDVMFVGRGTSVVSSNASHVIIATQDQFVGTVTSITSGNGLVGSPITSNGTLAVGPGAGISVNADDVAVNAKDGLSANSSGLWINNDYIRNLSLLATATLANNSTYAYDKQEFQLSVANAVFAQTANNATFAYGRQQGQLSVNNAIYLNGKQEVQLSVANAVFATTAQNVLGTIQSANNATYAYGKQEAQLSVANAVFATTAGSVLGTIQSANNTTFAYGRQQGQLSVNNSIYVNGKQEAQLSVANAVFATTAGSVLGTIETANNATFAYGKQESQLRVANAVFATTAQNVLGAIPTANNATFAYGKQEFQLSVATAVSTTSATNATNALNANNSAYVYGKQEGQLNVSYAQLANNSGYVYGKQETQLNVGFLNSQNGTYYSDIPARLGYTPVQRGTGTGQGTNTVKIGWLGSTLGLEIDATNYGASWPINITGSAGTAGSASSASSATLAAKASTLANGGSNGTAMTFNWSGQGGQPTWLWGGNDGVNMYVYNPSNFSVSYAATAGSATSAGTVTTAAQPNITSVGTLSSLTMGGMITGVSSAATDVNADGDNGSISIRGSSTTVAMISFHRTGTYAINMGLGTDNVFRIGGWSASDNAFQMDGSGNLTMLNNITAYSDIRLKKDIIKIDNALDKVGKLNGYTYTRTDTKTRQMGVIAQEVMKVIPEVVLGSEETNYSVAYGNMVGLLIEAIKELKAEIEELKSNK